MPIIMMSADDMPDEMKRAVNTPKEPFEKDGFLTGRPFIDAVHNESRLRAVGSMVYKRPADETFHEFLLNILADTLGRQWFLEESKKDQSEKHLLLSWYDEINEAIRKGNVIKENDKISGVKKTGNVRSLLAIAYDFYSLAHCSAKILPSLITRLKDKSQFQGARYEIAMGGMVARAGFNIKWINDKGKHVEFIGEHKITGDKAAFEAKSHHRDGVLGRGDGLFNAKNTKIKVITHVDEALKQASNSDGVSLVVFNDLNLPLAKVGEQKKWLLDVDKQLKELNFFDKYCQTSLAALYLTNFSWHFHQNLSDIPENELVAIFRLRPPHNLKQETLKLLEESAKQYGFVPSKLDEFGIKEDKENGSVATN